MVSTNNVTMQPESPISGRRISEGKTIMDKTIGLGNKGSHNLDVNERLFCSSDL